MGLWAVRGLPHDYDAWAANGATAWGHADVLPFFRKLETDLNIRSDGHGEEGPVMVRRIPPDGWPLFTRALMGAAQERGLKLLPDLNGADTEGIFAIPTSADHRGRVSAASAYLTPAVRNRPNLAIVTEREVLKVTFNGRSATGVTLGRPDGSAEVVRAREVILAAGAIHSPALLMRSGVGPARALSSLGVTPVHDLPPVGQNLQNHPFTHLGAMIRPRARQSPALRNYAIACIRLSSGALTPYARADADAGEDWPQGDLFLSLIARTSAFNTGNRLGIVGISLYAPFSRGDVTLDPRNPNGEPRVAFNLLSDERDAMRLCRGARFARALLNDEHVTAVAHETFVLPPSPPIRLLNRPGYTAPLLNHAIATVARLPGPVRRAALRRILAPGRLLGDIRDDGEFDALALAGATPMFHPTSTCAIGSVVDQQGRVIGVENLRVVDASIMPRIPRANTNVPTLMVAEKCAAAIKDALK
jgi:5-(hydroxymethyl)furfural/furfural oxidase